MNGLGQAIWKKLESDPNLAGKQYYLLTLRKRVETFPEYLGPRLRLIVTAESILLVQLAFAQHLLATKYVEETGAALYTAAQKGDLKAVQQGILEKLMSDADVLENLLRMLPTILKQMGKTDEGLVFGQQFQVSEALRPRYREGKLSIEDLLREDPGAIIYLEARG